jgi:hypothetical protein
MTDLGDGELHLCGMKGLGCNIEYEEENIVWKTGYELLGILQADRRDLPPLVRANRGGPNVFSTLLHERCSV